MMRKKIQDAQAALDKIDAPDNDEDDRLASADEAIRAAQKLSPDELESFAKREFKRFLSWITKRNENHKYDDDDYGDSPTGRI